MFPDLSLWLKIVLAVAAAFIIAFIMTPQAKKFAEAVGAVDQPNARRVNKVPIPRLGGIAVFLGFMISLLLFADTDRQILGIVLGAVIVAAGGLVDDIVNLKPWIKLLIQVIAAVVTIRCGVVLDGISALNDNTVYLGKGLAILITLLWIVGCTNAVNLIDGLDGLASGSTIISAVSMLIVSLMVPANPNVSIILAALIGACAGFLPYNIHPAKIFLGDVGAQLLGYVMASASLLGLFKMHAVVTMLIPVLALAVPIADTVFAFVRRLFKGQSPFKADKGHFHHRLLALGLSHKQVVLVLWGATAMFGLVGILIVGQTTATKWIVVAAMLIVAGLIWLVFMRNPKLQAKLEKQKAERAAEEDSDVKIYSGKNNRE